MCSCFVYVFVSVVGGFEGGFSLLGGEVASFVSLALFTLLFRLYLFYSFRRCFVLLLYMKHNETQTTNETPIKKHILRLGVIVTICLQPTNDAKHDIYATNK